MNPDRIIPGQVVQADDETSSRPGRPQETFLHKVAANPFGSTATGPAGRHAMVDTDDAANADDDTEVIAAEVDDTAPVILADTDSDDAEDAGPPDLPEDAGPPATTEDDGPPDTPAAYAGVPADDAPSDAPADYAPADYTPAPDADVHDADVHDADVHDEGSGTATIVAGTRADSPDGDEPLLGGAAVAVREEWRQVQASFVDDPRASVAAAAGVVADAAARLESLLRERQRGLRGTWDGNGQADTETLRQLMLTYRRLLTKLIS
jgi:hypothetical protein